MMPPFREYVHVLYGRTFRENDLAVLFSARLDETGTDGNSPYTVVAGAVATPAQWGNLERAWNNMLATRNVSAFHWKEFIDRKGDFADWSDFKCKRFQDRQEKIIKNNTIFRVSVGVESAVHTEIKDRMRGISGFSPDLDYSLCLRSLMFAVSEQLLRVDKNHLLSILVEDGPWAEGAYKTYRKITAMTGRWKPAKHAHRLVGFAASPKGQFRSLEAADYLAASEHARMLKGKWRHQRGVERLSLRLGAAELEYWYEGMIKEKEHRREFGRRRSTGAVSSSASSKR